MNQHSRDFFKELDEQDPLACYGEKFELSEQLIYLNGNSLGPQPKCIRARLDRVINQQWQLDLIESWNKHDWIQLPARVGEKIAPLIGANPEEVIATETTSINLFKLLCAALEYKNDCRVILTDSANFPSDLYIAQGLEQLLGGQRCELRIVEREEILRSIDGDTAIVMLSHVDFRTGYLYDMEAITSAAHQQGALMLWDVCHSVGAMPIKFGDLQVDMAIGCSYKYLNGGPGAPAFLYVRKDLQNELIQPLAGWFGHQNPFDFDLDYQAAQGIDRFQCSTPSILAMSALDSALELWAEVDLALVREKSIALTGYFIELIHNNHCARVLEICTPISANNRGSHVSVSHPCGYQVMQALRERKIIGDFRAPDQMRFGFSPLYNHYVDVWDTVEALAEIVSSGSYKDERFTRTEIVT